MSGENRAPLSGMLAFAIVFAGGLTLFHAFIPALLLAGGLGMGVWLLVRGILPYDSDLAGYKLDAQRRVRKLSKMLNAVQHMARSVKHEPSRRALMRGSDVVRDVITATQDKDPNSVASAAASLTGYLGSVQGVLTTYLALQDDPEIPGNREMLLQAQSGFSNFEQYAVSRKAQALRGDILQMKADLEMMKPLDALNPEGGLH